MAASSGQPGKLLLFGASGFVGNTIGALAIQRGWSVVAACRMGTPFLPPSSFPDYKWAESPMCCWAAIDILDRQQVRRIMEDHSDAKAIVSCVGVLTRDHKRARAINGDANVNIIAQMYEMQAIPQFVYLSAAEVAVAKPFLKGYVAGKDLTMRAMREHLHGRGTALLPGMISGTRHTARGWRLPLYVAGTPMAAVMRPIYRATGCLSPPVDVADVAAAAMAAATLGPTTPSARMWHYDDIVREAAAYRQASTATPPNVAETSSATPPPQPQQAAAPSSGAVSNEKQQAP